jgi:hypothetical protein
MSLLIIAKYLWWAIQELLEIIWERTIDQNGLVARVAFHALPTSIHGKE